MKWLGSTLSAGALLMVMACGLGRAAEPAGPQNHVVRIESMKFAPNVILVRPGDTVEFINTDLVPHTVTERSARAFDSEMIKAGETWRLVAGEAGTLLYRCIYHPDMTGKIVIGKLPPVAARGTAGVVKLCGVP